METELELAPIEAAPPSPMTPAAAAARAVVTIRQAALARFSATETHLLDMAARYKNVAWDTSTPKALAAVKAARQEMREQGRYVIQNLVKATKAELNDLKADVESEGDRLIAIIKPAEDAADAAIEAQKRIDEAAAEKARVERERKAKHEAELEVLRGYITKAEGKASADIARGLAYVMTIDVGAEKWEEFADEAAKVKDAVVETLRTMQATALAAEQEAERRAREQAELRQQQEHTQALIQELQAIQQQPIIALSGRLGVREGGTIECIRETLAETEAWQLDPEYWGSTMYAAAVATRDKAVADIKVLLAAAEAAAPPAPAAAPAPAATAPQPMLTTDVPHKVEEPAPVLSDKPVADANARAFIERITSTATEEAAEPAVQADHAPIVEPEATAVEEPQFKLGDIQTLLFGDHKGLTAAFVSDTLNCEFTRGDRGAVLFTKSQRRALLVALLDHVCTVADAVDQEG